MSVNTEQISSQDMEAARTFAAELSVNPELHQKDMIFWFLVTNPSFQKRTDAIRYYFYDGNNSAKTLRKLVREIGLTPDASFRMLEFASGYGCVTRSMSNEFPEVKLLCCDIHEAAVEFIKGTLKQESVLSHSCPEMLEIRDLFDVVFALSFFSHVPNGTWLRWLHALYARVSPGGFLIFTTHGKESAKKFFGDPLIPDDGFWFRAESEQKDLDASEYGQAVVTREFVHSQVKFLPSADIVICRPTFWWSHQDLYVIRRGS